jgi:hypothetical protein
MNVCWIQTAVSATRWTNQLSLTPPVFQLTKHLQMRRPGAGMSHISHHQNIPYNFTQGSFLSFHSACTCSSSFKVVFIATLLCYLYWYSGCKVFQLCTSKMQRRKHSVLDYGDVDKLMFVCLLACFEVLGTKLRTLHMLCKCSATEISPQPSCMSLYL